MYQKNIKTKNKVNTKLDTKTNTKLDKVNTKLDTKTNNKLDTNTNNKLDTNTNNKLKLKSNTKTNKLDKPNTKANKPNTKANNTSKPKTIQKKKLLKDSSIRIPLKNHDDTLPNVTITKDKPQDDSWDVFMQELNDQEVPVCNNTTNVYNGDVIDISLDEDIKFDIKSVDTDCYICGGKLCRKRDIVICQSCGVELRNNSNITEEQYSTSAITECNVNANGFIPIKMVGKGAYGYQRSLLKTCASYKVYRKANTLKDINNWNIHSTKHHIPKNVLKESNDMFAQIKEAGYVFRKNHKKGVQSACIYYKCYANGITKTPSEVANFSGIEEKFHSFGDRVLCDLNERGIISIPTKVDPIEDYVDRYMELLNIPKISEDGKKYKEFILAIIDKAEKNHLHVLHDSKNNTKCVGSIYVLVDRSPELRSKITKELIEKECEISKTTFIRYYAVVCKYFRKFKKIFKRYQILMKPEWRED